jgi:hypothetical protein
MLSQSLELTAYPLVSSFVRRQLDMQFDDLRTMMRMPLPTIGLTGGCNFACAVAICNLVAGVAKVLYQKPPGMSGVGDGFVALMIQYYPWQQTEPKERNAEILYNFVRNPLVHSLGAAIKRDQRQDEVVIAKSAMSEADLERLETSIDYPAGVSLAVATDGNRHTIWIAALYWGFLQLFRALCRDANQMNYAEARLRELGWTGDA